MAKINKGVTPDEATTVEAVTKQTFADVIGDRAQPSLKAIADIFEVPPQRIYSIAKQPISGQVYDARVYNWGAISRFIEKRIGKPDDKFQNFEEVYAAAIARDEEAGSADKRRNRGGSSKAMIDLGDGKQMPARKHALNIGDIVHLKRYGETEFVVAMLTDTHVVLQVKDGPALTCLSNWTYNQQVCSGEKAE